MNSKELITKIDIGRVGNGTQTYNDMCLILNKEETLELLHYIEQLEIANKNNEGLVRENVDLINRNLKLQEELIRCQDTIRKWMNDHKQLIIDNGKMKKTLDILKQKGNLAVDRQKILDEDDNYLVCYFFGGGTKKYTLLREINKEEYELLKSVLEEE